MGKYEVTFADYDLFAAATGRTKPADQGWDRGDRPVIYVSWLDAAAYADWLSQHTGLNYRLPSEAEWEYAARAGTTTPRYWPEKTETDKNDPACGYANVYDKKNESRIKNTYVGISWDAFACEDDFPFTAPVGKFKPNDWGVYDMLGNVWEWTQDCYENNYRNAPIDGSARSSNDDKQCQRSVRGGSWSSLPVNVRSANRSGDQPDDSNNNSGFRLARTI